MINHDENCNRTLFIIITIIIIINMMIIVPWSPGRRVRTWGTSRRRTQDFVGNIRLSTKHQCHQMMLLMMMMMIRRRMMIRSGNLLQSQLLSECDYLLRVLEFMAIILL